MRRCERRDLESGGKKKPALGRGLESQQEILFFQGWGWTTPVSGALAGSGQGMLARDRKFMEKPATVEHDSRETREERDWSNSHKYSRT
jgi:hypothetical protein